MGTLLLVRPLAQAAQQARRLQAAGLDARPFCVQDTQPDIAALAALPVAAAAADWLIFISPSCIELAWPALTATPQTARLACVGRSSAAKLAALSGQPVLFPQQGNDSDALLTLPELQHLQGQQVLIVRGEGGRAQLGETLARRGARVHYAEVYRRENVAPDWALFDQLCLTASPAILATSSASMTELFRQAGEARHPQLQACHFLALHSRIASTLQELGARNISLTADEISLHAALAAH